MNILLVPDRFSWGSHHTSQAIQKFSRRHHITIQEAVSLTEKDFKGVDLAVAMLNFSEEYIHRIADKLGVPVATRVGGWGGVYRKRLNKKRGEKWTVVGVCTIAPMLGVTVQRLYPEHEVEVLPNGVDAEAFQNPIRDGKDFVVGWVGRAHSLVKGYWWLATDQLKKFRVSTKVQKRVGGGKRGVVIPTKFPEEMVEYYSTIDALICTSSLEGTPNVVLEAMSARKPVVSTPCGVVPFVLDPDWICADPDQMMMMLRDLKRDPQLRRSVGRRNREVVLREWTWKDRTPPYNAWFEKCLRR